MAEYKWLRPDYRGACGHGDYSEHLPRGTRPGKWLPKVAHPVTCEAGYHTVDIEHLPVHWARDAILYEVECRGAVDRAEDKSAWEQVRLVRQVGRLTQPLLVTFACDCAERVPQGDAGKAAIAAARAWVACPCEKHRAAVGAAWAAAGAAWAAAEAAGAAERRWQGDRLIALLAAALGGEDG